MAESSIPLLSDSERHEPARKMEKTDDNRAGLDQVSSRSDEPVAATLLASVNPEELEGLTLYEKKCVLINHEMDSNGMGRYQWYIWILCGFGYFVDLLWAQAFGMILQPLQQELGFPGNQSGNISVGTLANRTPALCSCRRETDVLDRSLSVPV